MLYRIIQNPGSLLLIKHVSFICYTIFIVKTNLTLVSYYNPDFSKGIEFYFNGNTLKNAENHLRDIHFLDKGGDI